MLLFRIHVSAIKSIIGKSRGSNENNKGFTDSENVPVNHTFVRDAQ